MNIGISKLYIRIIDLT